MSDYPIITPKMRTSNKDFIGSICEILFPMDESSGDTITDIASGYQMTKAGSVYSVPHAVKNSWNNSNRSDSVVLSKPADTHILIFAVGIVDLAFTSFAVAIGASAVFSIIIDDVKTQITSSAGSAITENFDTIANTNEILIAATFNKNTGELRLYNGINGAVVNFATVDASLHLPNIDDLGNTIGLAGVANSYKGIGLLFPKTLPVEADLIDMLEVTRKNIINGHKWYDPRLSNY